MLIQAFDLNKIKTKIFTIQQIIQKQITHHDLIQNNALKN
jgi:hypothetical protein